MSVADHTKLFTEVYETLIWGTNYDDEYKGSSGPGSAIDYNINTYIPFLQDFIKTHDIKSVVDIGCGDWRCGEIIYKDLDVAYHGIDVYDALVKRNARKWPQHKWSQIDVVKNKEDVPSGDLLVLKDIIQHWCTAEIYSFLDHVVDNKKFKYILITNCDFQTRDDEDFNYETAISAIRMRGISAKFLPLKKYSAEILYNYSTKEVSLITLH